MDNNWAYANVGTKNINSEKKNLVIEVSFVPDAC